MKNFLKPLDFVSGRQLYGSALGASSVVLAKLLYNIELYTDNSMNNYLRNRGAYGTPYNALTYASNHIYHDGVTHSTPCGIVHTLAADSKKLATSVDAGWVDNLDNTYTGTAVTGDIVGISTDTSGVVTITLSSVTGGDVNGYTANGTYVFEETLSASLNLTGTGFTGIVTVVSIEAITLPAASYFHYYDTASKSIKQLSSTVDYGLGLLPVSTHYNMTNSYQYSIAATAPLTAADTAYIDANPEAMYRVLYDSLVLPSGFSSTGIVHFYDGTGGVVGNKYVQDIATALGSDVVVNGGFDTDTSWTKDTGWTITAGSANCDIATSSYGAISQPYSLVEGTKYLCTFEITSYTSGSAVITLSGVIGVSRSAIGTYSEILVAGPSSTFFGVAAFPNFVGSVDNISVKEATASEIANYTSNVRTNFLNTTYGATNLKLVKDASGRTTGVSPAGVTIWDSDSRQAVTNWTITAPFTVTEVLDGVTYTWTSDGNKYIAGVPSGTYTLPTGTWTLNDTGFDDLTAVTQRGTTKLETSVIIP